MIFNNPGTPRLQGFITILLIVVTSAIGMPKLQAQERDCQGDNDLALVNGIIHTMDEAGTIVASVLVRNDEFLAVGQTLPENRPCTDFIDLDGRTVIPGLIDNHVHFVRIGNRPGYDTREIESTFSVAEVIATISARTRSVPAGQLITGIGGFITAQWAEKRFPTIDELDQAAPEHPVYLSAFGFGPGQTNTAGRDLINDLGGKVAADGSIANREDTGLAYEVLAASLTDEHRQRQLGDVISWANKVGLTTVMDMSGTVPGVGFLDQRTGYQPIVTMAREGRLNLRTRLYFPALDEDEGLSQLQGRLDNTFSNFGSDMLQTVGIGEWSVGRALFNEQPLSAAAADAQRRIADRGWTYHQHLHSPEEIDAHLDIWEALDPTYDLSSLRWTAGHMSGVTPELVQRVVALGLGIGAHGQPYLRPGGGAGGPPWRTIVESGAVALGGGSDGARISPFNPWSMIYYMVTGVNASGELVNDGQQISRQQAVKLYSSAQQGWFTGEDNKLGGIAIGRFADLVVLNQDIFDETEVPDSEIRRMQSSLTIVGGRIVHSDGTLIIP